MAVPIPSHPAPGQPPPLAPGPAPTPEGRRPFRDNTRMLLVGIGVLLAVLGGLLALAGRSTTLAPDFLTEFVLYALSATNLAMLAALAFVLARNIVKLVVERRRALPFARFRGKLVAALLTMTLMPAVLVMIVGSELIRNSVDRWFNAPMDEVLSSANAIAGDYYQERQRVVSAQAEQLARTLATIDLATAPVETLRTLIAPDVVQERVRLVEVYRVVAGTGAEPGAEPGVVPVVEVAAPSLPRQYSRASADRLAERVAAGSPDTRVIEPIAGGELLRTAVPVRRAPTGPIRGVVIASDYLTGQFAERARRMTEAHEDYQQLRVLKQPLAGVYQSLFLMLTLLILVAATWTGLYLAKRITRPVQMLAAAAREIGAGHLDHRVVSETSDEFGSLVDAFNTMAGELAASRRRLERASAVVERKHHDVEGRRRYVETILERIATGLVSVDAGGRVGTINGTASRLLGLQADAAAGRPVAAVFGGKELSQFAALIDEASRSRTDLRPHEITVVRDGRELHLVVMATPLRRADGVSEGVVLVLDDVTPLIRAQRAAAWREVARRLAHEIKNPLTPIRLCAERLRRHFSAAPETTRQLVDECTATIVGEVESLKGLVDEFSEFARMPPPRTVPTDVHRLLTDTLALYHGLFPDVALRPRFAAAVPPVVADPEQLRRVMINVIDNAVEAMERRGTIDIETAYDASRNQVRIVVADQGPGIPGAERDKLFLPHYSTKRRGSGLGLAIVSRIVSDHGGQIDISDNHPHGTRFAIDLPC